MSDYDLRKATLPENHFQHGCIHQDESNDPYKYAVAMMIHKMQEAGFCGSEYHREPVKQLEDVLERLTGVGAKLAIKTKQKLRECELAIRKLLMNEDLDLDHLKASLKELANSMDTINKPTPFID